MDGIEMTPLMEGGEIIEPLGDRVLGLLVADMLFHAFPDAAEGELSVRLNALVNAEALAPIGIVPTPGDLHEATALVALAVPLEHHSVDRAASCAFGDHVQAGDLDHRPRFDHLVRDVIVVHSDVFRRHDAAFQFVEEYPSIILGEPAAPTAEPSRTQESQ